MAGLTPPKNSMTLLAKHEIERGEVLGLNLPTGKA